MLRDVLIDALFVLAKLPSALERVAWAIADGMRGARDDGESWN